MQDRWFRSDSVRTCALAASLRRVQKHSRSQTKCLFSPVLSRNLPAPDCWPRRPWPRVRRVTNSRQLVRAGSAATASAVLAVTPSSRMTSSSVPRDAHRYASRNLADTAPQPAQHTPCERKTGDGCMPYATRCATNDASAQLRGGWRAAALGRPDRWHRPPSWSLLLSARRRASCRVSSTARKRKVGIRRRCRRPGVLHAHGAGRVPPPEPTPAK